MRWYQRVIRVLYMKHITVHSKIMSEVGFEPTPSYEDQNTRLLSEGRKHLESGALDHSAILTYRSIM